jgi:hypothetical protein
VYHPSQIVLAPFGMAHAERRSHLYIIGKTGMGKTRLIQSMIAQDLLNGRAVGLIDPHGDLAWGILDAVPPSLPSRPFRGRRPRVPLRHLSSTSHSHAAPCAAWRRGVPAGLPRGAGVSVARGGRRRERWGTPGGALPRTQKGLWNSYPPESLRVIKDVERRRSRGA